MGNSNSSGTGVGCVFGIILGIIGVVIAVIVGVFVLFSKAASSSSSQMTALAEVHQTVSINQNELQKYTLEKFESNPAVDNFIAIMLAENATDLAKKTFIDRANGKEISWTMQVADISEQAGKAGADEPLKVSGTFNIPYKFRDGSRARGSAIRVQATFPNSETESLLKLRKDDWVTVTGKLSIENESGQSVRIIAPSIRSATEEKTQVAPE